MTTATTKKPTRKPATPAKPGTDSDRMVSFIAAEVSRILTAAGKRGQKFRYIIEGKNDALGEMDVVDGGEIRITFERADAPGAV